MQKDEKQFVINNQKSRFVNLLSITNTNKNINNNINNINMKRSSSSNNNRYNSNTLESYSPLSKRRVKCGIILYNNYIIFQYWNIIYFIRFSTFTTGDLDC